VRFEPSDGMAGRAALDAYLRAALRRDVEIDPATREIVTKVVDEGTGEVVRQMPDEALLRLRAYARELREAGRDARIERRA
jgi:hypothetical protein